MDRKNVPQIPIPYGKHKITEEDIQAVVQVLESDSLTQGPFVPQFEKGFSDYVGSQFAVAVSSGTAALHLCAVALEIKPGDKVITSPITFSASANCIRYLGGEVVFADIHPKTYLLDINHVRNLLQTSPKGTFKGIIPVNFAGRAINMEEFKELAEEFDLWIIEDACHSPGGYFIDSENKKQRCGNGNFADLAIFSFHPVKHIATGEGGMITTNSIALYEKLIMLRTHGITRDPQLFKNLPELALGRQHMGAVKNKEYPKWYMEMQILGYNYRLTDIQAALGLSQLSRAKENIERRERIASNYYKVFQDFDCIGDNNFEAGENYQDGSVGRHAYHLYVIETERRKEVYYGLRDKGILSQIHYFPVHLMPYYQQFGWRKGDMQMAEAYYRRCLSLPMYPTLQSDQQDYVIQSVIELLIN